MTGRMSLHFIAACLTVGICLFPACDSGDATDGDAADGDAVDGDAIESDAVDGEATDKDATDGDATDGDSVEGERTDGDLIDGDAIEGEADLDRIDGDRTEDAEIEPEAESCEEEGPIACADDENAWLCVDGKAVRTSCMDYCEAIPPDGDSILVDAYCSDEHYNKCVCVHDPYWPDGDPDWDPDVEADGDLEGDATDADSQGKAERS